MVGTGVYITWVTSALLGGILLMRVFKPLGKKVTLAGFVDMFRRYWLHIALVSASISGRICSTGSTGF